MVLQMTILQAHTVYSLFPLYISVCDVEDDTVTCGIITVAFSTGISAIPIMNSIFVFILWNRSSSR